MMKRMTVAFLAAAVLPFMSILLWKNELISENLMIISSLLSPIITIVFLVLVYKTFMQSLKQVIGIAKGIAGGNLHQDIIANSNDEVGELLMSMKLMQARL